MKLLCASVCECVCLKVYACVHACVHVRVYKGVCVQCMRVVYVVKSANESVHVLSCINIHKNALERGVGGVGWVVRLCVCVCAHICMCVCVELFDTSVLLTCVCELFATFSCFTLKPCPSKGESVVKT